MLKIVLFFGGTLLLLGVSDAAFKLEERYSWNQLDFVFPSQAMKDVALASGTYIPTNALPVGIEHWGNKLFVTVPRWRDGKCMSIYREGKDEKTNLVRNEKRVKNANNRFSLRRYKKKKRSPSTFANLFLMRKID